MRAQKFTDEDLQPYCEPPRECPACGQSRNLIDTFEPTFQQPDPEPKVKTKKTAEGKRVTVPHLRWSCWFCGFTYVTHIKAGADAITPIE